MDFIEYSQQYLRRFSCNKLKDLCKEKRIKGYTKYQKKQNLIDYIIKVKNNEDENKNRLYFQKQQLIHFYKKVKRINYKKYQKEENETIHYENINPTQYISFDLDYYMSIEDLEEKEKLNSIKEQEEFTEIEFIFGDIIYFVGQKEPFIYFIGKENRLIKSKCVPIEITQNLKNGYKSYYKVYHNTIQILLNTKRIDFMIELKYNDEFVKESTIGCIQKEWNWKIEYRNKEDIFIIKKEINNEEKELLVKRGTYIKDIKEYFDGQEKPQIEIELKIKKDYEEYKLIEQFPLPNTWKLKSINYFKYDYLYYYYEGPKEEINSMKSYLIELLKKEEIVYEI